MNDCVFCKIINKEIPCYNIYEDDLVLAFLDINPDSDGHTLIVPKKHYKDINDIPSDTLLHIYDTAKKIMKMLEDKLNCDGFSLLQNNGSVQEVKHYHLHLKPCYDNKESIKLTKITENISDVKDIYNKIN